LTESQKVMFQRVASSTSPAGFHTDKKPEHKVLESLLKQRLVKRGAKHPASGYFHYQVTTMGRKHLEAPKR
jgi:hypothetical protein